MENILAHCRSMLYRGKMTFICVIFNEDFHIASMMNLLDSELCCYDDSDPRISIHHFTNKIRFVRAVAKALEKHIPNTFNVINSAYMDRLKELTYIDNNPDTVIHILGYYIEHYKRFAKNKDKVSFRIFKQSLINDTITLLLDN